MIPARGTFALSRGSVARRALCELGAIRCSSSSGVGGGGRPKKQTDPATLHVPVMKEEVLDLWMPRRSGSGPIRLIDGTMGFGGHTHAALTCELAKDNDVCVLGVDRDGETLSRAKKRLSSSDDVDMSRVVFHRGSFSEISPNLLAAYSWPLKVKVDGILLDLGMNSSQIDNSARGFSFRRHGPLDMRYDTSPEKGKKSIKARDVVNNYSASEMSRMFESFANEPYAVDIAAKIVQWRKSLPKGGEIRSTVELRYIIEEAVEEIIAKDSAASGDAPNENDAKKSKGKGANFLKYREIWHSSPKRPLKKAKMEKLRSQYEERKLRHPEHVMRCFQALRIEVNNELEHIESFFRTNIASQCLGIGGRLVVLAFHPGEDQLVREGMGDMVATGEFKLLTPEEEGSRPTLEEVKLNGRSRTARLRAVERIR